MRVIWGENKTVLIWCILVIGEGTVVAREAANRWTGMVCTCLCVDHTPPFHTENVFAMKSWCKNKFSLEEDIIDKQFGIPEDFDYL